MNVNAIKRKKRELKIKLYQKIADRVILLLESVDDYSFSVIYDAAFKFNIYCVYKDIYLK